MSLTLHAVHPLLPMRNKATTRSFYQQLGFVAINDAATPPTYLMMKLAEVEIHFFLHPELDPYTNDGMIYLRTTQVDEWYHLVKAAQLDIPDLGHLADKPWGQRQFALRDPDHNLLTFGQPSQTTI